MKFLKWLPVILGIFGLIGVRAMEDSWFYDPLLNYFHEASQKAVFPKLEWGKLIISHLFRFALNLGLSALIIHFIFLNRKWTLQAVLLMLIFFAITFPVYLYCVSTKFEVGYQFSFYMRRFVIQPLILLLIIPMFYYRKEIGKRTAS